MWRHPPETMRTVIPFPKLHAIEGDFPVRLLTSGPAEFPANQAHGTDPSGPKVPEGESTNAAIDESPKARVLHQEIVGLIQAVRSRFG